MDTKSLFASLPCMNSEQPVQKGVFQKKNLPPRRSSYIYRGHQFYGVMVDKKPSNIPSTSCSQFTIPANVLRSSRCSIYIIDLTASQMSDFKKTTIRNIPLVLEVACLSLSSTAIDFKGKRFFTSLIPENPFITDLDRKILT